MAEDFKAQFGPQPYQFGQEQPQVDAKPEVKEEPTGVENIQYDKVTMQGAPDNPKNAQEVVERGLTNIGTPQTDNEEERQRREATEGYDSIIATLEEKAKEYEPETPEQKKKREKREKSARIVSAISDGLMSLSNLFFTTRYAPNMYNHEKSSILTPLQASLDKAKKEREANADKYLQFALKLGGAKNDRAKTLRELEAQKIARAKAQREEKEHRWKELLQPELQRKAKGEADKAEQDALAAKAVADNAQEMEAAKLATEKSKKKAHDAAAASSYASAADKNRKEFSAWDEKGKEWEFRTKEAADAFAHQHGTYQEREEVEITERTDYNNPKTDPAVTKRKRKTGGAGKPDPGGDDDPTA